MGKIGEKALTTYQFLGNLKSYSSKLLGIHKCLSQTIMSVSMLKQLIFYCEIVRNSIFMHLFHLTDSYLYIFAI